MTTIVVVKKNDEIAIASDALVTFGETRLPHGYEVNEKIFSIGDSYIGLAGSTAHFVVLAEAMRHLADECKLYSREQVFSTFQRLHVILKDRFFLNPKEDDSDPYEVVADHRLDCKSVRNLRCVFVSRSVQFRSLLGHRFRPQLRIRRDVRDV